MVLLGGQLVLMTVKVFSNLDDSVILSIRHCASGLHEDCWQQRGEQIQVSVSSPERKEECSEENQILL